MFCICFVIIQASLPRQGFVSLCKMSLGGSLSTWPEACGAVATREGEGTTYDLPAAIPSAPHSSLCFKNLEGFFGGEGQRRVQGTEEETGKKKRNKQLWRSQVQRTRSSSKYAVAWKVGMETHQWGFDEPKPEDAFVSVTKLVLGEMVLKA